VTAAAILDAAGTAFERAASREDELRVPADGVRFVAVDVRRVIAVDGEGSPELPGFQAAIGTLFPVAYGLHFALKRRGIQAPVGALEGLWWTPEELDPGSLTPGLGDLTRWHWTLLIGIPDEATEAEVLAAIAEATRRRGSGNGVRVVTLDEGRCAQVLHVGPYSAEAPTIERLHAAIAAAGLQPRGRHHEIYLGDPRRSAPQRLRTLIRQPVDLAPR
jgi:hypothetical protein